MGSRVPAMSPDEGKSIGLTNTLTGLQIDDLLTKRADDAYKQSPDYLNQGLHTNRTNDWNTWNTSKSTAYGTAKQNILNSFIDLGEDPSAAAPYLHALDVAANDVTYHPGEDYRWDGEGTPTYSKAWNEQAYLQKYPDVAAEVASGKMSSGREHYERFGISEGRQGEFDTTDQTGVTGRHVVGGTTGTGDDPNTLLNTDYGVGEHVAGVRKGRKDTAYNNAVGTIDKYIQGLGLNPDDFNTLNESAHSKIFNLYNTSGLSSNDYSKTFDPQSIIDSTVGGERTLRRGKYTTQAKSTFNGVDPNADFADTADDQYINDIVGSQYGDAFNALDRAYKRGALTDVGYNAGLGQLGTDRSAALSTANALGGAVLTRDRGELSGIKDKAVTDAGAWDFGQSFDPNSYKTQYDTKKASLQSGLGGEVATALQGQNFFDVGNVLNKAGFAQGAQNTAALTGDSSSPDYLAALGDKSKNKTAQRGLGGTGVF